MKLLSITLVSILLPVLASLAPEGTESSSSWVTTSGVLLPDGEDELRFDWVMTLTETYIRDTPVPAKVRLLSTSIRVKCKGIEISSQLMINGVPPDSGEPVVLFIGAVDLSKADYFAQQALGLPAAVLSARYSSAYQIVLQPLNVSTWSEVGTAKALSVTCVEPARAPGGR